MTIARAQMNRQLYQMGGIGSLPMDYGQSLQVPQQMQPSFSSAQNITMNPLLNYGQTPLTMAGGGITRLNYGLGSMFKGVSSSVAQPVEGGSTSSGGGFGMGLMNKLIQQNPQMFKNVNSGSSLENRYRNLLSGNFIDENKNGIDDRKEAAYGGRIGYQEGGMDQMQDPMMQQQMQQPPLEGIMNAMPQEAGGAQQGQEGSKEQTALLTIVQLLIEQGIPPEQARELAMQILQAFNQGGAPAVEEFANQLEQQEGMQGPAMMANGGIMGYAHRQNYGFGSIFKSVGKAVSSVASAVKSVAKSPIGQIALAIAAPYAIGAMFPTFATLGGTGFMGAALRAGISNLAIQGITTGKFNPKQALMAAVGGGVAQGVFGPAGGDMSINPDVGGIPDALQAGPTFNPTLQSSLNNSLTGNDYSQLTTSAQKMYDPGMISSTPQSIASNQMASNFANLQGNTLQQLGELTPQQNIFEKGIASLKTAGTDLMNNPIETIGKYATSAYDTVKENALPLATGLLVGSSLAQQPDESDDAYASRAARDANVAAYITQYGRGSKLYSPNFYSMEKAVDPFAGRSTYAAMGGRIGYEYGSMPMGEPRKNQAGITELDYRAKGGFVPPIGIKEKADDIPAMLSNNEFVFTADAVRNAGGGNVNKGAQKMYGLMKQLEAGGMV